MLDSMSQKVLLSEKEIHIILHRLACQLLERHLDFSKTVLIGLQPRGIYLAERLCKILKEVLRGNVLDKKLISDILFRAE